MAAIIYVRDERVHCLWENGNVIHFDWVGVFNRCMYTCQNLSNLVLEIDYIEHLLNGKAALSSGRRNCWVCCLAPIKISAAGGRSKRI